MDSGPCTRNYKLFYEPRVKFRIVVSVYVPHRLLCYEIIRPHDSFCVFTYTWHLHTGLPSFWRIMLSRAWGGVTGTSAKQKGVSAAQKGGVDERKPDRGPHAMRAKYPR